MYRLIKSDFQEPETYLTSIRNPKLRQLFTNLKLLISDHSLMIEIGRRTRPITPVSERKCTLYSLNAIEDKVHFLIACQPILFPTTILTIYSHFYIVVIVHSNFYLPMKKLFMSWAVETLQSSIKLHNIFQKQHN